MTNLIGLYVIGALMFAVLGILAMDPGRAEQPRRATAYGVLLGVGWPLYVVGMCLFCLFLLGAAFHDVAVAVIADEPIEDPNR